MVKDAMESIYKIDSLYYIMLYDMIEQTSLAKGSKNSGVKPDIHYKNPVVVLIAHLLPWLQTI